MEGLICEPCNRTFFSLRSFQHHMETRLHKKRMQIQQSEELNLLHNENKCKSANQNIELDKNITKDTENAAYSIKSEKDKIKEENSESKLWVFTRRSGRATNRPKRYTDYNSDESGGTDNFDKGNTERTHGSDEDAESVSKAIETVLEHEKKAESGADTRLLIITDVAVGQVAELDPHSSCTSTQVIGVNDLEKENSNSEEEEMMIDKDEENIKRRKGNNKQLELRGKDNRSMAKEMRVFPCKFCEFSGGDMLELHEHALEMHPKETTRCEPCSHVFLTKAAFKVHCAGSAHQRTVSKGVLNQVQHVCPHCNKQYPDEIQKNLHVEFVHLHVSTEEGVAKLCQGRDMVTQLYGEHLKQTESLSYRTQVACPDCGKFFMKNGLVEHLRSHTNERPYKCRHCVKCFPSPNTLRRHLLADHITTPLITCDDCGKQFKRNMQYTDHLEMHKNKAKGVKWVCDICNAIFYLEKCLEAHVKRHGERKYKCKVEGCHYAFINSGELMEHMYTHTREKKFLCDICGHEEGTKTRMRRHDKTHQPRQQFPCDYCPYKAHSKSHLQRHMRIHIGSKPFRCLYCAYTCNTAGNMRKHILNTRKHEGMSLYPCKFCDFGCNEAKEFKQHLHRCHMDYVKQKASEPLVVFTGLYHPEEDAEKVPEGAEIHQVMKGRFVKVYDGTRIGAIGEALTAPKKKSKVSRKLKQESQDLVQQALEKSQVVEDSNDSEGQTNLHMSDASSSAVSLVAQDQEQATAVGEKVYPKGPPWQFVTTDDGVGKQTKAVTWVTPQGQRDVAMQQTCQIQDLQVVRNHQLISDPGATTTSFVCNPSTISILGPAAISLDHLTTPLEPGTYQLITHGTGGHRTVSVTVRSQK